MACLLTGFFFAAFLTLTGGAGGRRGEALLSGDRRVVTGALLFGKLTIGVVLPGVVATGWVMTGQVLSGGVARTWRCRGASCAVLVSNATRSLTREPPSGCPGRSER